MPAFTMRVVDLGQMAYGPAWEAQQRAHAQVLAGGEDVALMVEHVPPVVTLGRQREASARNLRVGADALQSLGVDLVETDRGGNVTFHGPGQLVVYPIVRLARHNLTVGGYVRRLQDLVSNLLGRWLVTPQLDDSAVGVWVADPHAGGKLAKICAIGVRVRRGVTLHGFALNIETDLRYFDLIVPCGLEGRGVTSLRRVCGLRGPTFDDAKWFMTKSVKAAFGEEDPDGSIPLL